MSRKRKRLEAQAKSDLCRIVAEKYREVYGTGEYVEGSLRDRQWDLGGGVTLFCLHIYETGYTIHHQDLGALALGREGRELIRKVDDEMMRAEDSKAVQGFLEALT